MIPNTGADSMTYEEIPYASEQGIFAAEQGIKSADQGIFQPDQGILIWGCPAGHLPPPKGGPDSQTLSPLPGTLTFRYCSCGSPNSGIHFA
jgi:hypothetical protein